jgi:hypothetical protein
VTDVSAIGGQGWKVLADVETHLKRYVVYPGPDELVAHVLWIGHTWLLDSWDSTPRIAFLSPEPGSGKSRALEVTAPLVPNPVHAVNATPAYLFRKVADQDARPTVLFDEIDTIFGPRAKDNEELRGLLNAGHRRGAVAGRCVVRGKEVFTEELPAYAAVALAGLDDLPETLMTRSVVVRMRRRKQSERRPMPWRARDADSEPVVALRERMERWTQSVAPLAGRGWPTMPDGVEDRDADVWEALLAVADLAGGVWPQRARDAAVRMVGKSHQTAPSLGVLLLRDTRQAFEDAGVDKMPTEDLLERLNAMEESPWGDLRGNPLNARGLAWRLSKYSIRPSTVRDGSRTFKGYVAGWFADSWERYLAPPSPDSAVTSVTTSQDGTDLRKPCDGPEDPPAAIRHNPDLSVTTDEEPTPPDLRCDGVTDVTAAEGHGGEQDLPTVCQADGCTQPLWAPGSRASGYCEKHKDLRRAS